MARPNLDVALVKELVEQSELAQRLALGEDDSFLGPLDPQCAIDALLCHSGPLCQHLLTALLARVVVPDAWRNIIHYDPGDHNDYHLSTATRLTASRDFVIEQATSVGWSPARGSTTDVDVRLAAGQTLTSSTNDLEMDRAGASLADLVISVCNPTTLLADDPPHLDWWAVDDAASYSGSVLLRKDSSMYAGALWAVIPGMSHARVVAVLR